jgi:cation transport ATPase
MSGLAWDDPAQLARFTRWSGEDAGRRAESTFLIEGMHCAACSVLIDDALKRLPGVEAADVNPATRRAQVRWQPARTHASALARAIESAAPTTAPCQTTHWTLRLRANANGARCCDAVAALLEDLMARLPETVERIGADGRGEVVALTALARGDTVRVRPGQAFPGRWPRDRRCSPLLERWQGAACCCSACQRLTRWRAPT